MNISRLEEEQPYYAIDFYDNDYVVVKHPDKSLTYYYPFVEGLYTYTDIILSVVFETTDYVPAKDLVFGWSSNISVDVGTRHKEVFRRALGTVDFESEDYIFLANAEDVAEYFQKDALLDTLVLTDMGVFVREDKEIRYYSDSSFYTY